MNLIKLKSPAKVNLYLKVLNKKLDGFHTIETIFERINLCDEIVFKFLKEDKIIIKCDHPHVPCGPKNLVYKVAEQLKKDFNIKFGASIDIKKNIPVAAGLAGGSTNAATALIALNQLWNIGLNKKQLGKYASQMGSDINFFLENASFALGTDRGQVIKKIKIKAKLWHILVVPKVKVYAKDVYQNFKISASQEVVNTRGDSHLEHICKADTNVLTKDNTGVNILIHNLEKGSLPQITSLMENDLQQAVIGLCPKLKKLQERLKSLGAKGVMVSGSGPCVYGLTSSEKEAQDIKRTLEKIYSQVYVVSTL